jgi:hypothetical protein
MEWFNGLSIIKKVVVVFLLLIALIIVSKLALLSKVNLNTIKLID